MKRLRLWARWSRRDLRRRWAHVLAIALVVAIGTGMYSGLGSMESWRVSSNDASFALLRAHDLEISLSEGTFAERGTLERIASRIESADSVERASERLIVATQVEVARAGTEPLLVAGQVVGSELGPEGPPIDGIAATAGRSLRGPDSGRPVAVLEAAFSEFNELAPSGELRLAGGSRLRYVGHGRSPEYFLVTRPGGGEFGGAESGFAVVFTSLGSAQRAVGDRPVVNDLVLRLEPAADLEAVREQLAGALAAAGLAGEVTTLPDEPAHRVLYKDAEGDQALWNIFAVLILAGAGFATFNLASRVVEAQRREIGIGMALGVPPSELAIRPLLFGAQIAVAGAILGVLVGIGAAELFRGVLEDLLPLPVTETPFQAHVFVRGALIGLVLPLIATVIPVWRGLRMTPVEAIRIGFRSAKSAGLARVGRGLRLPGSSLRQLPLRNALRTPRRTLMTALGIGAVVSVVVAFLGFVDSFLVTVDRSEAEVTRGAPNRVVVELERIQPESSKVVDRISRSPATGRTEPWLALPSTLGSGDASIDGTLTLIDFEDGLWRPGIAEGRAPAAGELGVVIAEEAARDLGVGPGDELSVTHPVRRDGAFALAQTTLVVTGTHPNPFRVFAYADRSLGRALGVAGLVNVVSLTPAAGVGADAVARSLFSVAGISAVEPVTATSEFVRDRLDDFIDILRVTVGFALALALLIAFNSSSINADERARETATMLAFGVPVRSALGLAVGESLITGLLGTALGLGGGLAVIGWVVNETLPDTLPDLGLVISISGGSLAAAALVGIGSVALAPLLTVRRMRRMDIPSTLRVVE